MKKIRDLVLLFINFWSLIFIFAQSHQSNLSEAYERLTNKEYDSAYKLFQQAVGKENGGIASLMIGNFYLYGYGRDIDKDKACEWYRKSAEQGIPRGLDSAAKCILDKSTDSHSAQQAIDYYLAAAEMGHHISYCHLAELYYEGNKVKQDVPKALLLCERSAQQGSPPAMLSLAKMHLANNQVDSLKQAKHWFGMAAQYNVVEAHFHLGKIYKQEPVDEQSVMMALQWFESAASLGFQPAYLETAKIYFDAPRHPETGQWQEVALAKAYLWLSANLASEQAPQQSQEARQMLSIVKKELPATWYPSLDKKVSEHLSRYNSP